MTKPKPTLASLDAHDDAIDQRLAGISSRLDQLVTSEQLTDALTAKGWKKVIGGIKAWSPLGAAIAISLFVLLQWGEYREFRGRTDARLSTVEASITKVEKSLSDIQSQLFAIRARTVSSQPTRPQNQADAKTLLAETERKSIPLPVDIVVESGKGFIEAAKQDVAAWDTALLFVNYRSGLNAKLAEIPETKQPESAPPTVYATRNVPGAQKPKMFATKAIPVPIERAAILAELSIPTNLGLKTGDAFVILDGGATSLNGMHLRHVILKSVEVHYSEGSPTILDDVIFVNCTFVFDNTAPSRKLGESILTQLNVNFSTGA